MPKPADRRQWMCAAESIGRDWCTRLYGGSWTIALCVLELLIVLALFTGCSRSPSADRDRVDNEFIAVVGAGKPDPLWPVLCATAESIADELVSIEVRTAAPDVVSVNSQANLIRRLHKEGMRGLCIQVIDPPATVKLLESLRARGVVVVTMIRAVDSFDPFDHCGANPQNVGIRMADELAKALPAGGDVIALQRREGGPDGHALQSAMFRHRLLDYPGLRLLATEEVTSPGEARTRMISAKRRYPGLAAFICPDHSLLTEATDLPALVRDAMIVVTADPFPSVWPMWDSGINLIAIGCEYDLIAPRALRTVYAVLRSSGQRNPPAHSHLRVVTPKNSATFRDDWKRWTE